MYFNQLFFYLVKPTAVNPGFNKLYVNAKCLLCLGFECKSKFLIIIIFISRVKLQTFRGNHRNVTHDLMRVWLKALKDPRLEDVDKIDQDTMVEIAESRGFKYFKYNTKYEQIAVLQEELREKIRQALQQAN